MKALVEFFLKLLGLYKEPQAPVEPEVVEDSGHNMTQISVAYYKADVEFLNLKAVTLAQWILESGWGKSQLSKEYNNFAGLKWRGDLGIEGATSIEYAAHDGKDLYARLPTLELFIEYYWKFLDRDVYSGWRDHADTPRGFIQHLLDSGYTSGQEYVEKVMKLLPDAEKLLEEAAELSAGDERREDNDEGEQEPPVIISDGAGDLWYPDRMIDDKINGLEMKTRGRFNYGYPEGLVVHFTAGRSRNRADGGIRNGKTNKDVGISHVKYAVEKGSYSYFVIDRDGHVYQQFPLDRWGYHAGQSSWPTVSGTVSDHFVGVEVLNAGKLEKTEGGYKAWFTNQSKGDKIFQEGEVRYTNGEDNMQKGVYHAYSEAQEEALEKLIVWLYRNSPYRKDKKIFSLENVVGHDEVAPNRKNDPGASLSMSMPSFRKYLKGKL